MVRGIVYMFTHKESGKMYIGQTTEEKKRIRGHLYAAARKGTRNEGQPFVHALRECGMDAFEYSVLEEIHHEDINQLRRMLEKREEYYIALYDATRNGYNITRGGSGMKGFKLSQESIESIRQKNTGKHLSEAHKDSVRQATLKRWSDLEYRKKMSERMSGKGNPMYGVRITGEKHHCYGKPKSEDTKRKLSEAKKGRPGHPMSEAHKQKLKALVTGVPKSPEHRRKLSEALIGTRNPKKWKPILQYSKNGEFIREWNCITDAEKELGIVHVSEVLRGKRNYAGGFIWKYKTSDDYPKQIAVK